MRGNIAVWTGADSFRECPWAKKIVFMFKKILTKLKQFLGRFNLVNRIELPRLHKLSALIMLIPFVLQPFLSEIFIIDTLKIAVHEIVDSIPLLNLIDPYYIPFYEVELKYKNINYSIWVLLPIFLLAAVFSQWLVRRSSKRSNPLPVVPQGSAADHTHGLEDLNRAVLPIWNRQIESARLQSEVAVKDLAKQFGGIAKRLNESIQASVSYANDGASNIGTRDASATGMISQQELAEMLDTLKEAIDVKSVLLEKINELKEETNAMKEVLSSVKAVSRRTEVLAINASIEARRAGVHGKSFGIVANEVRKLSEQSDTMVDNVGQRVQMLEVKMDEVIAQTNINANGPAELAQDSNKTMSLYERFRMLALSLSKSSEILLVESSNIKNEINEILVALQYQDKTSQIMIHVLNDIEALVAFLEKNRNSGMFDKLDVENWLDKLYATYTMVEEKRAHTGEEQSFDEPESDDGSLEFF